jgi:hypothetical protein
MPESHGAHFVRMKPADTKASSLHTRRHKPSSGSDYAPSGSDNRKPMTAVFAHGPIFWNVITGHLNRVGVKADVSGVSDCMIETPQQLVRFPHPDVRRAELC